MAIPNPPSQLPDRATQSQSILSTNMQAMFVWVVAFAQELINTSAAYFSAVRGTSTDSLTISVGTKSFNLQTGLGFELGNSVSIANSSTNYMVGVVDSYDSSTGAMVVNVSSIVGSGSFTNWTVSLAAVGASNASDITTTAYGTLSGTNIESQVRELEDDKANKLDVSAKTAQSEAEAGSNDVKYMTALKTKQAIDAQVPDLLHTMQNAVSLSGTSVTVYNSIPSGVNKFRLKIDQASTNGTSDWVVRVRTASGVVASNYSGAVANNNTSGTAASSGIRLPYNSGASVVQGFVEFERLSSLSNIYLFEVKLGKSDSAVATIGAGRVNAGGVVTGVDMTTNNGTDSYDGGNAAVSW